MNLSSMVGPAIGSVNPFVTSSIQRSTGSTTGDSGKRTPSYSASELIQVQKQALQYNDLVQVDGLNISGEKCAMYIQGKVEGINRTEGKGGDLITTPDGKEWLVTIILEDWSETGGWCKVACVRQNA